MNISTLAYFQTSLTAALCDAVRHFRIAPDASIHEPAVVFSGSDFHFAEYGSAKTILNPLDLQDLLKAYAPTRLDEEDVLPLARRLAEVALPGAADMALGVELGFGMN